MSYAAVIPVKKISSRLPGKNLLSLGKESLLERKIRQLQSANIADRIIVSSDSDQMLKVAEDMGVEAIKRPNHFANESRPLTEFFRYVTTLFSEEHLIWSCVTSPFFNEHLMKKAHQKYADGIGKQFDSLITTYQFKHYLLDRSGPLNYQLGEAHKNSQELEGVDLFTNGLLIAPRHSVEKWGYNYGSNHYRFYVNQIESLDIDTPADYEIAKAYLRIVNQ